MAKATERPKGFTCPRCRVRLLTVRTTPRADGSVQRTRRCRGCKYTVTSYERAAKAVAS